MREHVWEPWNPGFEQCAQCGAIVEDVFLTIDDPEPCPGPPTKVDIKDLEITRLHVQLERLDREHKAFMAECLAIVERRRVQVPIPFAGRREGE